MYAYIIKCNTIKMYLLLF